MPAALETVEKVMEQPRSADDKLRGIGPANDPGPTTVTAIGVSPEPAIDFLKGVAKRERPSQPPLSYCESPNRLRQSGLPMRGSHERQSAGEVDRQYNERTRLHVR